MCQKVTIHIDCVCDAYHDFLIRLPHCHPSHLRRAQKVSRPSSQDNKAFSSGSHAEMQKVSKTSLGSCFLLYFIASVFGYFTFYNYVQSDLLLTYNHSDPTNPLTLIVRVCVLIGVILTLPLTHFPVCPFPTQERFNPFQGPKSGKFPVLSTTSFCLGSSLGHYGRAAHSLRDSGHQCSRYS